MREACALVCLLALTEHTSESQHWKYPPPSPKE